MRHDLTSRAADWALLLALFLGTLIAPAADAADPARGLPAAYRPPPPRAISALPTSPEPTWL